MEKQKDNNGKIAEVIAKILFDSDKEQEMTLFTIIVVDLLSYHLNNMDNYRFTNLFKQHLHIDNDMTTRDSKSLLNTAKLFMDISDIYKEMGNHIETVHERLGKPTCTTPYDAMNILNTRASIQANLIPIISDPVKMQIRIGQIIEDDPSLKELANKENGMDNKSSTPKAKSEDLDNIQWPDEIDVDNIN